MCFKSVNKRAVQYAKRTKQVTTLYNGERLFRVRFHGDSNVTASFNELCIFAVNHVDEIWLGCGSVDNVLDMDPNFFGNAVLIRKGNFCWLIGTEIHVFTLKRNERIVKYVSTVGNSGVPAGYLETNLRYIGIKGNNCNQSLYIDKKASAESWDQEVLECMSAFDVPTKPFNAVSIYSS